MCFRSQGRSSSFDVVCFCRLKALIPIKGILAEGCAKFEWIFFSCGRAEFIWYIAQFSQRTHDSSTIQNRKRISGPSCCFSRPGEDLPHGTQGPDTPEADQRSGASPDPPGDPQRWRCRAGRAQPTGTSVAACQNKNHYKLFFFFMRLMQ